MDIGMFGEPIVQLVVHVMNVRRVDPQQGYDLWAETYDTTPNAVVRFDERITPRDVEPRPGERILDAGCGTGRYFPKLIAARSRVTGMDFSAGMLRVARQNHPAVPLVVAELQRSWPFPDGTFDAVLCALVGEHLDDLAIVFEEMHRVLVPSGRAVFSVYHPAMADAGKEAHFFKGELEYRLGAVKHSLADYRAAIEDAGFEEITLAEHHGDQELASSGPGFQKFLDFPLLIVFRVTKRGC